jgi:hypothetical protein
MERPILVHVGIAEVAHHGFRVHVYIGLIARLGADLEAGEIGVELAQLAVRCCGATEASWHWEKVADWRCKIPAIR